MSYRSSIKATGLQTITPLVWIAKYNEWILEGGRVLDPDHHSPCSPQGFLFSTQLLHVVNSYKYSLLYLIASLFKPHAQLLQARLVCHVMPQPTKWNINTSSNPKDKASVIYFDQGDGYKCLPVSSFSITLSRLHLRDNFCIAHEMFPSAE